jgi:uncharacterized membrane protein
MDLTILWIKKLHNFASRHLLYPITLSTFLVFVYFTGRVYLIQKVRYQFLIWNLFLAWLPYSFSLVVSAIHQVRPRWWWALIIPGTLWLLFLPNAFYIVTDFIHLTNHPLIPIWYDAGLLAITSWTGIFLAVVSLYTIQRIVRGYLGNLVAWGFSMLVIGLNGYGVYLGRFLRWNSWDLFFDPIEILSDSFYLLRNPMDYKDVIGFIVMYTSLFLVTYLTFSWLLLSRQAPQRN